MGVDIATLTVPGVKVKNSLKSSRRSFLSKKVQTLDSVALQEYNSTEIAKQITLVDFRIFRRIQPKGKCVNLIG